MLVTGSNRETAVCMVLPMSHHVRQTQWSFKGIQVAALNLRYCNTEHVESRHPMTLFPDCSPNTMVHQCRSKPAYVFSQSKPEPWKNSGLELSVSLNSRV